MRVTFVETFASFSINERVEIHLWKGGREGRRKGGREAGRDERGGTEGGRGVEKEE